MPIYVHFMDTSILCNFLRIPNKDQNSAEVLREYDELRKDSRNKFILPYAAILETGNHIAHISDNNKRYEIAGHFKELLIKTAKGTAPWSYFQPDVTGDALLTLANDYPEHAGKRMGMCDLSIIQAYNKYITDFPIDGKIRIWTMDQHLKHYYQTLTRQSKREMKKQRNKE